MSHLAPGHPQGVALLYTSPPLPRSVRSQRERMHRPAGYKPGKRGSASRVPSCIVGPPLAGGLRRGPLVGGGPLAAGRLRAAGRWPTAGAAGRRGPLADCGPLAAGRLRGPLVGGGGRWPDGLLGLRAAARGVAWDALPGNIMYLVVVAVVYSVVFVISVVAPVPVALALVPAVVAV